MKQPHTTASKRLARWAWYWAIGIILVVVPVAYAQFKQGQFRAGEGGTPTTAYRYFAKQHSSTGPAFQAEAAGAGSSDQIKIRLDGTNLLFESSGDAFLFTGGNVGVAASTASRFSVGAGGTGTTAEVIQINGQSGSAGHAYLLITRNAVNKALLGVEGSAGALITGSAADDLAIKTFGGAINFSADSGTTNHLKLTSTELDAINGLKIGSGAEQKNYYSATASLDYAQASANTCETLTIAVTGALEGSANVVRIGMPNALWSHNTTSTFSAAVSANDTVAVRRCVISADGSNPAAATVRAAVIQH